MNSVDGLRVADCSMGPTIYIGIDQSINSTGITVLGKGDPVYYLIVPHLTRKMKEVNHPRLMYVLYEKHKVGKDASYTEKERAKTLNIYNIAYEIKKIINQWQPKRVVMEGIAYGQAHSAALADLAGLSYIIRTHILSTSSELVIVSPSELKRWATGNGVAEKGLMVYAWEALDKIGKELNIKIDDLADSYFMAVYGRDLGDIQGIG